MSFKLLIRAPSVRCGLFAAVSALALTGCVSAVNEQFDNSALTTQTTIAAESEAAESAQASAEAAMAAEENGELASANSTSNGPLASEDMANSESGNQIAALVTQPTGISATQNSIFANGQQDVVAQDANVSSTGAPAFVPVPAANPAIKSLYQQDLASQAAELEAKNAKLRQVVEAHNQSAVNATVAAPNPTPTPAQAPQVNAKAASNGERSVTLAAFFAAAAQKRSTNGLNASSDAVETMGAHAPNPMGIALVGRSSMGETFDDEHEEDTDEPAGLMKLASLSSLSRVAPNGLRLQTERVSVACMKPELINRIKAIETHYRTPVVVTSGYRPRNSKVRRGSLHHSCDAADIQVAGVSKWELAKFLRSMPDRGGVGTYCHTESVHLDLGEARDWNWRCRAPKKS